MNVIDRIEQAPACEVINLSETEKDLYTGAGWKLARFENGTLTGFFDPQDVPYHEDPQQQADEAVEAATAWLANARGEIWLVMCSCYQLCEPRQIVPTDASALARMARVFGEQAPVMTDYVPPTPDQVREFLRAHGLTGSAAADLAGLNSSAAIRKYTGGAQPHRMSYAVWFTLHAKVLLAPSQIEEIDAAMKK